MSSSGCASAWWYLLWCLCMIRTYFCMLDHLHSTLSGDTHVSVKRDGVTVDFVTLYGSGDMYAHYFILPFICSSYRNPQPSSWTAPSRLPLACSHNYTQSTLCIGSMSSRSCTASYQTSRVQPTTGCLTSLGGRWLCWTYHSTPDNNVGLRVRYVDILHMYLLWYVHMI